MRQTTFAVTHALFICPLFLIALTYILSLIAWFVCAWFFAVDNNKRSGAISMVCMRVFVQRTTNNN